MLPQQKPPLRSKVMFLLSLESNSDIFLERSSRSTLLLTTTTETAYTTTTIRGAFKDGHVEKDILVENPTRKSFLE